MWPRGFFSEEDLKLPDLGAFVDMCVYIHQSVERKSRDYLEEMRRHNYVTPTSYLELLASFKILLKEKRVEIGSLRQKLQNGLDKLGTTAKDVAELEIKLIDMKPKLLVKITEVEALMAKIAVDKEDAEKTRVQVEQQSKEAEATAAECRTIKESADADLAEALPALDRALEALNLLKKTDIDEVKGFKKPTPGVVLTIECVAIMLGLKPVKKPDPNNLGKKLDDYWEAAQASPVMFKDAKVFVAGLTGYDRENIKEALIKIVETYTVKPEFQPDVIKNASTACYAMCMFCHAMVKFFYVSRSIEPKRQALKAAQDQLAITQGELAEANKKLADVSARVAALEEGHRKAVAETAFLKEEVDRC